MSELSVLERMKLIRESRDSTVTNTYFLAICGEFVTHDGFWLNPSEFKDCNRLYETKDKVIKHLATHGGCDIGLLEVEITRTPDMYFSITGNSDYKDEPIKQEASKIKCPSCGFIGRMSILPLHVICPSCKHEFEAKEFV